MDVSEHVECTCISNMPSERKAAELRKDRKKCKERFFSFFTFFFIFSHFWQKWSIRENGKKEKERRETLEDKAQSYKDGEHRKKTYRKTMGMR